MAYRDYIKQMKKEWIGKKVHYNGFEYTVVDVDYNGSLMIDRPNYFYDSLILPTTAVGVEMLDKEV